jgi:hypothetical protein
MHQAIIRRGFGKRGKDEQPITNIVNTRIKPAECFGALACWIGSAIGTSPADRNAAKI